MFSCSFVRAGQAALVATKHACLCVAGAKGLTSVSTLACSYSYSSAVLLCGCLPFDDDSACISSDELVKARFQLRYPRWAKNLSPSAKDLLSHLLDVDPLRRYTAEEALDHPWVRGDTAPKENVLASPKQMKKSPAIRMGSVTKAGARLSGAQQRRKAPADVKFSPPTPQGSMVRKTSI